MQKDGTLGENRAKEDYLLQPFQNGKLHMVNVPLPRDGGKRPEQHAKRIYLLVGWICVCFSLKVELFFCFQILGSFPNGKDTDAHCII